MTAPTLHAPHPLLGVSTARAVGLSFVEARPPVVLAFTLRFVTGGALAVRDVGSAGAPMGALVGAAGWILIVWGIYLLNGITDVVEDRANGSRRPIATGRLLLPVATRLSVVLVLSGLVLCMMVDPRLTLCAVVLAGLGAVYSLGKHAAKRRGNVALAVAAGAAGLSYIAGSLALVGDVTVASLLSGVVLSAWVVAGGRVKDLSDVSGDAAAGRQTAPITLGFTRACRQVAIYVGALGLAGFIVGLAHPTTLALCLLLPAAGLLMAVTLTTDASAPRHERRRPYRIFMLTQYALNSALILVAVTG